LFSNCDVVQTSSGGSHAELLAGESLRLFEASHGAVSEQHILKPGSSNSTFTLSLSDQPCSSTVQEHSYLSGFVTTLDERLYIHLVTSSLAYVFDRCGRIYPRRLLENYAVWPGQSSKVDWTIVDVLTAGQGENTSELTAVQYRRVFVGVLVKHVLLLCR